MLNCLTWNKFAHGLDGVKSIHFENDGEGYTINHGSIIEFLECTHFSGTSSSLNTVSIGIMDCLSADPYMFYSAADGVWSCKETLELLLGTARVLEGGEKTTLIWRAKAGGVLVRKSSSHLASEPIVETH